MRSPLDLTLRLLLVLMALTISSSARAVPIEFNTHFYEFIQLESDISWTDARAAALGMTFNGESGYLVTITTAEEPKDWAPAGSARGIGRRFGRIGRIVRAIPSRIGWRLAAHSRLFHTIRSSFSILVGKK